MDKQVSDRTLTICFWLGVVGWPWGFVIAAIIGKTEGFLAALRGMFACFAFILVLVVLMALFGVYGN